MLTVQAPRSGPGSPASWIAAAALAVLSFAVAAAVTMPAAGLSSPAAEVSASYVVAPSPVLLAFPTPSAAAPRQTPARLVRPPRPVRTPAPARTSPARTPAAAPGGARCSGAGWEQRRGSAALASLLRPSDAQRYRVEFRPGRADVLGLAHLPERRVEIFVRSCSAQSDSLLRHVIAHEIGHLIDADTMPARRTEWLRARGISPSMPWFGCDSCSDFATPAGDFAEVYAQWQRSASDNPSELAPAPSSAALAELAGRFFGAGRL